MYIQCVRHSNRASFNETETNLNSLPSQGPFPFKADKTVFTILFQHFIIYLLELFFAFFSVQRPTGHHCIVFPKWIG